MTWAALIAVVGLWALYLFVQGGQPWDECEHSHTAWLMSLGEKPLTDFFEHHQPVLWSALALYYRAGFHGAGVLIWGRILVVLSGLASIAALYALGRADSESFRLRQFLGCGIFIALTLTLREVFVIRPETLAAGLFFPALALWNARPRTPYVALAGALAGMAVYTTPRVALLGGFFLLMGTQTMRRWLLLIAGAVAAIGVYTIASGYPLQRVIFNVRFSAYLQSVGDVPKGLPVALWTGLMLGICIPLALLAYGSRPADRPRGLGMVLYAAAVFAACYGSAGLFQYEHAYSPFMMAVSIAGAWIGGRLQWRVQMQRTVLAPAAAIVLLVPGALSLPGLTALRTHHLPGSAFFRSIRGRDKMAALVPPGGTVLLYPQDNPITIKDASYYGIPLWDAQDRLCRTVRGFEAQSNIKLPDCDFMKTLQDAKPYFTEAFVKPLVSASEVQKAEAFVKQNYRNADLGPDMPPYMRTSILERNDR